MGLAKLYQFEGKKQALSSMRLCLECRGTDRLPPAKFSWLHHLESRRSIVWRFALGSRSKPSVYLVYARAVYHSRSFEDQVDASQLEASVLPPAVPERIHAASSSALALRASGA